METDAPPRALTAAERAVLDAMLVDDIEGVEHLRRSAARAVVTGGCDCGCPTIAFRPVDGTELVLVAQGALDDDPTQLVLLFANSRGELEALELEWTTEPPPSVFPPPSELRVSPMDAIHA